MIYYLIFINIVSFIAFGIDKKLAIKNMFRISESCLLFLSLIGGALGGLVGMYFFHHKTKKTKFKTFIPICLIIWIIILKDYM